ncbi:hypothetical protein LI328DRAFT_68265 [Trichoderma asperelloides]|nr:hypothetical protein LI328DRAFT_68265 [Trichoderma asperelloides]
MRWGGPLDFLSVFTCVRRSGICECFAFVVLSTKGSQAGRNGEEEPKTTKKASSIRSFQSESVSLWLGSQQMSFCCPSSSRFRSPLSSFSLYTPYSISICIIFAILACTPLCRRPASFAESTLYNTAHTMHVCHVYRSISSTYS